MASREQYLTVLEYRERVQFDTKNFFRNDPELVSSRPIPHPRNPARILSSSGSMAGFFPLYAAAGKVGVKLFLQKIPDLGIRYEAIGATLRRIASPHFIRMEYREGPKQGALWGAYHTPYLKMDFVNGVVLKDKVVELAARQDAQALLKMAEQWQRIALMMEREQIAHGDIQAENLMVERRTGQIRLVDLDTMFVPSLRPKRLRCVAFGIPAWQHPQKQTDEAHFDERLDRFPALAMYLCLLALSHDPSIINLQKVGEHEILLTGNDLRDPHNSRVLQRLSGASNGQIRRLTEALVKAAMGPYDDVPAFSKVTDPDVEAKEALRAVEEAIRSGDHRRVRDAWKPVLAGYGPAQALRAEFDLACKHLEKLERLRKAAGAEDDQALSAIWLAAPNLQQCACAKNEQIRAGVSLAARGTQAAKRMKGIEAVRLAIKAADGEKSRTGYYGGPEEQKVWETWNDPNYDLAKSQTARGACWERVEEAGNRLVAFKQFEALLTVEDDENIAKAWPTVASFGPAVRHQKRVEDAMGRMKVLGEFVARLKHAANDEVALWTIWTSRPDMAQCKSAAKPVPDLGGLVPAQRATLAGKRVEALTELIAIFDQHGRPPLNEAGERHVVAAWKQREAILGPSPTGAAFRKRADEAQSRLKAWEVLLKGVQQDDDEQITKAWNPGLMATFTPAEGYLARAKEAVARTSVVAALACRLKEDPEDEAGLIRIASERSDMQKCLAYLKPQSLLAGHSWRERIETAREILRVRLALTQVLSAVPLDYEQLLKVWNEALCRKHRLFAKDLPRIDEILGLGRSLQRLRTALEKRDIGVASTSWREEFRSLMKKEELEKVREAMQRTLTGPNCVEHLELTLTNHELTARWDWRGNGSFCFLAVQDGHYPDLPQGAQPNAFREEATGGLVTMPFRGNTPHARLWAMFRFLDQFYVGAEPLERRLMTIEYSVSKALFRRHWLVITSLSGEVEMPALEVVISENPLWPTTEEAQRIPKMRLSGAHTVELALPATLSKGQDLYISLRPIDRANEEWLRLRPAAERAVVIRI